MRRYLIHIGPHKTGTTYVQMRLDAARDQLRAAGVVYPATWRAGHNAPSHLGFFERIRHRSLEPLRQELADLPDDTVVLVSSEDLQVLDESEVRWLADLLATPEVMVVYYCRRWSDLLPSIWQERVKHGRDELLPDFLAAMMKQVRTSPLINYGLVLDRFLAVFGAARVHVVSYSEIADSGIDLAEHFVRTFLLSFKGSLPPAPQVRANASIGMVDIEVIRALNALHISRGGAATDQVCAWFQQSAAKCGLSAIDAAMRVSAASVTLSDDAPALESLHRTLFAQYGAMMVPPTSGDRLFRPSRRVVAYVGPGYLADPMIAARIEGMYRQYLAT